jgi:phage antirepressor YoqD-like protein
LILVAQNCPEFTARIVDRWQELEAKQNQLPDFNNPILMARTWADNQEAILNQQLMLEQKEQQLVLAAPKVKYVDRYVDRNNLKNVTDVAKELGITGKALGLWLRENGHAWKKKDKMVWTQSFVDNGYGASKQFSTDKGYDGTQALITAKGDLFIKESFGK